MRETNDDGMDSWAEAVIRRAEERPLPSEPLGQFFRHAALKLAEKWIARNNDGGTES